jgi:hypothetical protein
MTEANRARVAAAIRAIEARIAYLGISRASNPPMFASKGLVSLGVILDKLARRNLEEVEAGMVMMGTLEAGRLKAAREQSGSDWLQPAEVELPDAGMLRRYGWYVGYASRFLELLESAQHAAKLGALQIRSPETGVVLRADSCFSSWLAIDFTSLHDGCHLPTACAEWPPAAPTWPDNLPMPPGGLRLTDAESWAIASGIANPGELLELMGCAAYPPARQGSAPVLSVVRDARPAQAPDAQWTPERLVQRQTELKNQGVRNHTQRLAAESGIEEREVRRQIASWRKAGPLGAITTQLTR